MKTISRYIMTLALLLTAVTGAWAVEPTVYNSTVAVSDLNEGDILIEGAQVTLPSDFSYELNFLQNRYFFNNETTPSTSGFTHKTTTVTVGANGLMTGLSYGATTRPATESGEEGNAWEVTAVENKIVSIVGITYTAEAPVTVEPVEGKTNQWTFAMPGSDVVLTPIYAKAAAFATTGTGSEAKTLLPEAAEGVIAGTDAPLIADGTGIVAFAGESTEATQGTLMYAIGTSDTQVPELTAFSPTVPTAENVADDGADVLVWYYIQGADAPQGEAATLDNTFSDTEPACLTVQVLTNKFDITLNAANANTIEAGKATVTIDGTAATVTDGKLQGVKMGNEVKLKAKEGYKFRKVEVKKAASAPSLNITSPEVGQFIGSDGKNYAYDATMPDGVTKVAMITYVGSETGHDTYKSGLAIALRDEGEMDWATAKSTCEAKSAFTNAAWMVPSVPQWFAMCEATGNDGNSYYGSMKYAMIAAAGEESSFKEDGYQYWSSSEISSSTAYCFGLKDDTTNYANVDKDNIKGVRAVLAF